MSLEAPALADDQKMTYGMLLYPGFTLLDLAGPHNALALHGRTELIWKTLEPVPTDTGITINPTVTFADCPRKLDVLFVPGGFGTAEVMKDESVVEFLREVGQSAGFVSSVCTGSLLLAVAGLLDGYKATSHWAFYGALEEAGVEVVRSRVVSDRNRITGGGVTSGIDFGLTLLARLCGERAALTTQLCMEYDPKPPFSAGSPAQAGQEIAKDALAILAPVIDDARIVTRAYFARNTK
jgi:cyclohexyl-isocyanide hydratase